MMRKEFSIITSKEWIKVALATEKLKNDGLKRNEDWNFEEHDNRIRWIFFSPEHSKHYGYIFMNAIGFESVQVL